MYETILLATDASEDSRAAVDHAVTLARASGATLHAVSVVETRTAYDNAIVEPETVRESLRADARDAVEAAREAAERAGIDCETSVEEGPPPDRLLEAADRIGADLVVVGATGRSPFKRLLLGSTSERLLTESPVPVAVIGAGKRRADE